MEKTLSKGDKPMGAAFSHARTVGSSQSRAAQRRRANDWLKSKGHAPIGKGVMDRWRALSMKERQDAAFLESQGFSPELSRALSMAGVKKAAKAQTCQVAKKDYSAAYVDAAKAMLPDELHRAIHLKARGSAGGVAARRSRAGSKDATKADMVASAKRFKSRATKLLALVDKSGPTIAELSPDGMTGGFPGVGGGRKKVRKSADPSDAIIEAAFDGVGSRQLVQKRDALAKTHTVASISNSFVAEAYEGEPSTDAPDVRHFLDAQRLVRGMDFERLNGAPTADEACARASRVLAADMGHYDQSFPGDDNIKSVGGLNLDLGSGLAREVGFLGLDLYPADYGTIIHDLGLGIPFPDGSARAIRLINALDSMPDYRDAPMPLMFEVQRALAQGGRFYYLGKPLDGLIDYERLPGLQVDLDERTGADDVTQPQTQKLVLSRRPARIPVVYGADTRYLSNEETMPADLQVALDAWGSHPKADVAMANLVHKAEEVEAQVRIVKRDAQQQIVYGVVLSPEEVDSQNDIISADEIRDAAHKFLIDARVVGREHDDPMKGAHVVESFIAPCEMQFNGPYGPQTVTAGSWILGVWVSNEDDWQDVLNGEFTGFSVGGWGDRKAA